MRADDPHGVYDLPEPPVEKKKAVIGRPPTVKNRRQVTISLDEDSHRKLQNAAKDIGVSMSAIVRAFIEELPSEGEENV